MVSALLGPRPNVSSEVRHAKGGQTSDPELPALLGAS